MSRGARDGRTDGQTDGGGTEREAEGVFARLEKGGTEGRRD